MLDCLAHPSSPALFSPDNPCLSSGCLTTLSQSHCHTLHHPNPLYSLPPLLPLLSEALQTRRWLLYTMAPVFTGLFTCLQAGGQKRKQPSCTEVPLFLYTLCIPERQCVGLVTIKMSISWVNTLDQCIK